MIKKYSKEIVKDIFVFLFSNTFIKNILDSISFKCKGKRYVILFYIQLNWVSYSSDAVYNV